MAFTAFTTWLFLLQLTPLASSYTPLTDGALQNLPHTGDMLDPHKGALLAPIMIPRVPETEGSAKALRHFTDFFTKLNWTLEFDNFTDVTPISTKPVKFSNLIATLDPPWKAAGEVTRLVLVAHYDSLRTVPNFVGATDSAAPCAMLMHVAQAVTDIMKTKWDKMDDEFDKEDEQGLMILLLDGEEAFHSWSDTDSIYGARHLAQHWENTKHPAHSTFKNHLSSINLFVLLDLLGAPVPNVPSQFESSHWAYQHMSKIETRLRTQDLLNTPKDHKSFLPDHDKQVFSLSYIGDDHTPFLHRGVQILHLIAYPFPQEWHRITDDADHLDKNVVQDWAIIMNAFVVEWFGLEPYLNPKGAGSGTLGTAKINKTRANREL